MGVYKFVLGLSLLVLLAALGVEFLVSFGIFEHVYNHQPGKCVKYEMNGSEDMVLLPNGQVLISSGIYFWEIEDEIPPKPEPGVFMFDFKDPTSGPKRLAMDQSFLESCPDFTPHGVSQWITGDSILLYIVNHRRHKDTIEVFQYNPETLSLVHRRTFEDPLIYNVNDLVVVQLDKFYLTNDRYFLSGFMKKVEGYLRLPLASVTYYDGEMGTSRTVASGLRYANGIAKSTDGTYIYVNNLLRGEVVAYRRNADNSLTIVEPTLPLQVAIDNTFVDPTNGHLWVAILPKPLAVIDYFKDRSIEIASQIVHVAINESSSSPFESYQIEELFATGGDIISATTIGVYSDGHLLIGTIGKDMLYCEVPYLMY